MRLGIDLGTTRTVVAAADRGNFPVVGFTNDDGDLVEYYPTVTAEVDGRLVHGLDAEAAAARGAPVLRSWKRFLGELDVIHVGEVAVHPVELVAGFLRSLAEDLGRSNVAKARDGSLEVVVSVPANAHSTQRFVTLEGFKRAGFDVILVLNEPSAAGVEYAHRHHATLNSRREHVVVYDLGGGTFDAALVRMTPEHHDVVTTAGVSRLGGDDFDAVLLAMALETAGLAVPTDRQVLGGLLHECRTAKEALLPQTRKMALDLVSLGEGAPPEPVVLPVAEYYERLRPLVAQTLDAMAPVLASDPDAVEGAVSEETIAGIYMVGGACGLPVVPRIVRERFGRRVHRSPHPSAATAIGLAILSASADAPAIGERFTRHFGVFREGAGGQEVTFDGIFEKGTPMPEAGAAPLTATRRYRAAHNLGHFRFIESGDLDAHGQPCGDLTPHGDVRFAFSEELADPRALDDAVVERLGDAGPWVEERYEVDAAGIIAVTITDVDRGRSARYVL